MPNETRVSADGVPSDGVGHALPDLASQTFTAEGHAMYSRHHIPPVRWPRP